MNNFFSDIYSRPPDITVFAPARVNLIGEHTDYNGGMVLPTALDIGITVHLATKESDDITVYSSKFEASYLGSLHDQAKDHWADYAIGAMVYANKTGLISGGADILIETNMPDGAGLSSSAALIVGILKATRALSNHTIDDVVIATIARQVENEYIGMPCGIMDQMAIAIARPGQALALDTKSLTYDLIDLPTSFDLAVIHSGIHRKLTEGRYKERKEECDLAKEKLGTDDLCLVNDEALLSINDLPDNIQRRARHCAMEHRRTGEAATALRHGDMVAFGALMNQSHLSMRDNFEMSLPAIDALVADAQKMGALGARLTGGGFGGCIVACVASKDRQAWEQKLLAAHPRAFKIT